MYGFGRNSTSSWTLLYSFTTVSRSALISMDQIAHPTLSDYWKCWKFSNWGFKESSKELVFKRPAGSLKVSVVIVLLRILLSELWFMTVFSFQQDGLIYISYGMGSRTNANDANSAFSNLSFLIFNITSSPQYSDFATWLHSSLATQIMSVF